MIEPPGETVRWRVFEVDDRVFIAIEHCVVKERARSMKQSTIGHVSVRIYMSLIEARKDCGRSHTIEAMTVIQESEVHERSGDSSNLVWKSTQ